MTRDELVGHVEDVLKIASLSEGQTTVTLLSRVNGADPQQLLAAALVVAREQQRDIADLKSILNESEEQRAWLEDDVQKLQAALSTKRKQRKGT